MSTSAERWVERAIYDLETARSVFASERHLYVLFCCQQAVEKMLKAIIAERTKELPPRLHNLVRLAEVAALETSSEQTDLLRELSSYYMQSRYPEEIEDLAAQVKRDEARRVLDKTEELMLWLNSML